MPTRKIEGFMELWSAPTLSERANSQLFLAEPYPQLLVFVYRFRIVINDHHSLHAVGVLRALASQNVVQGFQ